MNNFSKKSFPQTWTMIIIIRTTRSFNGVQQIVFTFKPLIAVMKKGLISHFFVLWTRLWLFPYNSRITF